MGRVPAHLRPSRGEGRQAHPDAARLPDPAAPSAGQAEPGPHAERPRVRVRAPRPVRVGLRSRRLGRRRSLVVAVIVVGALVVVVGGGLWAWRAWQAGLAEQQRGTGVPMELDVPGYGEGSSPIPLRVTGTTDDGSSVRGVRIVTQTQGWLSLYPGTYEVEAVGSPVTASGGTFSVPQGTWRVRVTSEGGEVTAPEGTVSNGLEIAYEPVQAADVTDEDVDAIRAWMVDLGVQGVEGYTSLVEAARGRP